MSSVRAVQGSSHLDPVRILTGTDRIQSVVPLVSTKRLNKRENHFGCRNFCRYSSILPPEKCRPGAAAPFAIQHYH